MRKLPITAEVSIVVAAHNPPELLEACLAALDHERAGDAAVEVIVCRRGASLPKPRTGVRCLSLGNTATVPDLRHAGLCAAHGEIVAFLEDHLRPAAGWLAALRGTHHAAPESAAVGGPIDPVDTGRMLDWAAYFCEYGWYLSPLPSGPTRLLSAANVSYKREAAEVLKPLGAVWETRWHARLGGGALRAEPAMRVLHERRFAPRDFLVERFTYGRDYARTRVCGALERVGRALAAPLLPAVLTARLAGIVFSRHHHRARFVAALPWLLLFLGAWSVGEAIGYASPSRLRPGAPESGR